MVDAQTHSRELTLTRIFDAPRDVVFAAWTEPKHLAQWFGPRGFTIPSCTVEAKLGGEMRLVMRANDEIAAAIGTRDHPVHCVFKEFEKPSRLGFTNDAVDADGNVILNAYTTVTFEDQGGKTRMTFHTEASGKGGQVAMMLHGMEQGWSESFDKLAEIL
jgi:uncharacterized protein YndB with AHSA1/START domain